MREIRKHLTTVKLTDYVWEIVLDGRGIGIIGLTRVWGKKRWRVMLRDAEGRHEVLVGLPATAVRAVDMVVEHLQAHELEKEVL